MNAKRSTCALLAAVSATLAAAETRLAFAAPPVLTHIPEPIQVPAEAPPRDPCGPAHAFGAGQGGVEPHRYELAGFPIIGGNSDIGVQFGGAATLTHFCDDVRPYLWNLDLLLTASSKADSNGFRIVQQSYVLRLDTPALFDGRVRMDGRANYQRTINEGYYGLGNASSATIPDLSGVGRRFQYTQQEARTRFIVRVRTKSPFNLALGLNLRFESPDAYPGSKLSEDAARGVRNGFPLVRGLSETFLTGLAAGVIYDTRDSEFVTTHGAYYQLGASGTIGTADGIGYGNTSAILAHYAPILGPITFASRFIASFSAGNLPFYDLQQGGTFEPQYLFGGESGVRGVPNGRYAGKVMVVSNTELRITFPRFRLLGQSFRFGSTAFFDAGRVWNDYGYDPALDGRTLGLKFGVGGGLFVQWGLAAIFRAEAAYSPDAVAENPAFPVGFYVSDGLMF